MARNGVNTNLVLVAGIGVGAYLLFRWLSGAADRARKAAAQALEDTSSAAADVAEWLIPHTNIRFDPSASILLGDNSVIPASAARGVGSFTDTDGVQKIQFYYQGRVYRTTDAQPDGGWYYAA